MKVLESENEEKIRNLMTEKHELERKQVINVPRDITHSLQLQCFTVDNL